VYENQQEVYVLGFKRHQVEEALAAVSGVDGDEASSELRIRVKRLLDADRALGREPEEGGSERTTYAFYSDDPPGSGWEVWFSSYEAFALLIALLLLRHGWPQGAVVRIMRRARPTLEPQHARILAQDSQTLFDQDEVRKHAQEGMLAVDNTDPVFLAIVTAGQAERGANADAAPQAVGACRGQVELVSFIRRQAPAGMSTTSLEVTGHAHRLAHHLSHIEPKPRGRRR